MIIDRIDFCLDGGTARLKTEMGNYYIDKRIHTSTPLSIYAHQHPNEKGSYIVDRMWDEVRDALRELTPEDHPGLSELLEEMEQDGARPFPF